jgi:hypothetical protein
MLVSIDPGLNHVAFACWTPEGKLIAAGLVKNPSARDKTLARPEIWMAAASALVRKVMGYPMIGSDPMETIGVMVEIPEVHQRGSGKGDPNDLIDVAGVAACCVAALKAVGGALCKWAPKPKEWKGQLPKEISSARVLEKLTPDESSRIEPCNPGLLHNIHDAIHMGLVFFKR